MQRYGQILPSAPDDALEMIMTTAHTYYLKAKSSKIAITSLPFNLRSLGIFRHVHYKFDFGIRRYSILGNTIGIMQT